MPRYKATERGHIPKLGLIEPGQEFSYDGPKGSWMEEIPTGEPDDGTEETKLPPKEPPKAKAKGK